MKFQNKNHVNGDTQGNFITDSERIAAVQMRNVQAKKRYMQNIVQVGADEDYLNKRHMNYISGGH